MSAKTVNAKGSAEKMKRFFDLVEKYGPVNFGDMRTGNKFNSDRDALHGKISDTSIVHFVFADAEIVEKVLAELKQAELGTSVIVTGLVETTEDLCKRVGLNTHTVEFSGGIHGKVERLQEEPILEMITMCGHGMVAGNLVKEMIRQIKRGKRTLDEAALELTRPCQCGVFNPKRAERLLEKLL
jgi:hypothetical protein